VDFNNNLILNFTDVPIGTVQYRVGEQDPFDPTVLDEITGVYNPNIIYFRFPGEHIIDGINYDMEIQMYAFGFLPNSTIDQRINLICYPVKVVNDTEVQTKLFDSLGNAEINKTYTINSFDDFINPFTMFSEIYFYDGKSIIKLRL
jgi:hypothetical protein